MEKNTKYKRVTLNEVAAEAGVSAITVSRTIRAPDMVSAGVRKKVQAAIELATSDGPAELVAQMRQRLELYRKDRPYRESFGEP